MFLDPNGKRIEFASPACAGCRNSARCRHLTDIDRGRCPLAESAAPTRRFREDCKLPHTEEGLLVAQNPGAILALVMGSDG